MIVADLQSVASQQKNASGASYVRNLLKEVLQLYTLDFIYGSGWGKDFLFKGGTCLRICFDLPRLSEDLDFDIKNYSLFNRQLFVDAVQQYFAAKWQLKNFSVRVAGNNRQLYLQFPILKSLGVASRNESDVLFLRLDLSPVDSDCYSEEVSIKTDKNLSFIMKRYSLPDLFSSKIAAIVNRTFRKGKNDVITFKGRDYFDLIWFLQKGVTPNYERLENIVKKSKKEILSRLDEKVGLVKPEYLKEDLAPLFGDGNFIRSFCQNFRELYQGLRKHLD